MNRIQKLLMTEYDDFDDTILIESPFAQVTGDGFGIKQVQLGLTTTKLFIATDVFFTVDNTNYNNYLFNKYNSSKYVDPEIESLELLSIIPLHLISMNCIRKGQRQILKINYCTKRTMYFEFGGLLLRNLFWNIWRDRIRTLRTSSTFNFINKSKNDLITNSSSSEQQILVTSYKDVKADVHHLHHNKNKHVTLTEDNINNIVPKALREFVQEYRMKSKSNLSSSGDNSNSLNNIHSNSKNNNNSNNNNDNNNNNDKNKNKNKKDESDISLLNDIRNNFVNKQYNVTNQQNNQVLRDVAKFFLGTTHNNILENEQPLKSDEKCLNYLLNGCPSFADSLSNTNNNINNNNSNNNINSNEYLMNCKEIATK